MSTNGNGSRDAADAIHSLAISISRELNTLNPNDLLAQRVLALARQNAESLPKFQAAAKTFGRFRDIFLQEVWMDSKSAKFTGAGAHDAEAPSGGDGNAHGKLTIGNLAIEDSEVMMPAKQAPGGLMRPGGLKQGNSGERHVFKAPKVQSSELGLDKLAAEKRKERLLAGDSPRDSKRGRYDSGDDSNDSDCEPESEDMNVMVPMGMFVCRSFWAHIIGPMVLVWRWNANSSNELQLVSSQTLKKKKCAWQVH